MPARTNTLPPLLFVCLALPQGSLAQAQKPADTRPNIIFIFTGDHATQANGAYERNIGRLTPEQRAEWDKHFEPENEAFREKLKVQLKLLQEKYGDTE